MTNQQKYIYQNGAFVPSSRLNSMEIQLLRADMVATYLTPYELRSKHLDGLFQKIMEHSLIADETQLRAILGEQIIDDFTGTWHAMLRYFQALGFDRPLEMRTMHKVGEIVMAVIKALEEFYLYADASHLRQLANRYRDMKHLPLPDAPVSHKKALDANKWIARRAEQLQLTHRRGNGNRQIDWLGITEVILQETRNPPVGDKDYETMREVYKAITFNTLEAEQANCVKKNHNNLIGKKQPARRKQR